MNPGHLGMLLLFVHYVWSFCAISLCGDLEMKSPEIVSWQYIFLKVFVVVIPNRNLSSPFALSWAALRHTNPCVAM